MTFTHNATALHGINSTRESHDPSLFHHQFQAWLPDDVLGPKVDNFIALQRAKVIKISREQVKLRIGSKHRYWWNRAVQNIPLEVTISFGEDSSSNTPVRSVDVTISPLLDNVKPSILQSECIRVIRHVRESLVAHESTPMVSNDK